MVMVPTPVETKMAPSHLLLWDWLLSVKGKGMSGERMPKMIDEKVQRNIVSRVQEVSQIAKLLKRGCLFVEEWY